MFPVIVANLHQLRAVRLPASIRHLRAVDLSPGQGQESQTHAFASLTG